MAQNNVVAMTDDGLILELVHISERIGESKFTGFTPKKLVEYQKQYRYELLRRLSAQTININK